MKKTLLTVAIVISLVSVYCSSEKAHAPKVLNLPSAGEDILNVSFFADTVLYVPLETTEESLIGSIKGLWMDDSNILVNTGNRLLMFSENGKYMHQVGSNGRGPGEYNYIYHFDVIRDTIYVSSGGDKLLRYTFDGAFHDEITLGFETFYFSSTTDQKLVCYQQQEGLVYIYDENPDIPPDTITVEYGVTEGRYGIFQMPRGGMSYLQKTVNGLLFNSFRSDTIWNITSKGKEPVYILDIKDPLLPYEKQIEFFDNPELYQQMASPYSLVHIMPFPSRILIFQFHHTLMANDAGYDVIYIGDPATGEIKRYDTSCIYDDIVSGQKLSNERLRFFHTIKSEKYLVTTKDPFELLKGHDIGITDEKYFPSPLWIDQMKTIKENDNPVLVMIKIKK